MSRALCCSGLVLPRPRGNFEVPEAGPLGSTSMVSSTTLSSLPRFSEQGGLSVDYSRTRVFQMPPHIRASLGLFGAIMWVWGRWQGVFLGPASVPGETTQGGEQLLPMDHQASLTCQRAGPRTFDATSCVVSRQARLPPYWREGWGLRETQWLFPGHTASRGEPKLPWAGLQGLGLGEAGF